MFLLQIALMKSISPIKLKVTYEEIIIETQNRFRKNCLTTNNTYSKTNV